MPSYRVDQPTVALGLYEVVGEDGDVSGFIKHVGLAASAASHPADRIPVLEMGPPLRGPAAMGQIKGSAIGNAELTEDELRKIKTFVDRHAGEHAAFSHLSEFGLLRAAPQMYIVLPHVKPLEEADGRYARTRFSCVGFVFEAYKAARIRMLDLDKIPLVEWAIIAAAYPAAEGIARGIPRGSDLGLAGSGPWPVLLCGYLLHALNRDASSIRSAAHVPNAGERYFPSGPGT